MQTVAHASHRVSSSIFMSSAGGSPKHHYWFLKLACGHEVERRIRWRPQAGAPRGWGAVWNGPSLNRLPDPPRRARCS